LIPSKNAAARIKSARIDSTRAAWSRRGADLIVCAVALAASGVTLLNGFAQDDVLLIKDNSWLHGLGHWRNILSSPYWPPPFPPDLFRPVASLLLALQYALGNGAPIVFHIVSCALYLATGVAVLRLAAQLLPSRAALATALVFAAHPVHVEAIAAAVNQGELIVALLGTIMFSYYLDRRRAGLPSAGDWSLLAALYALAGLTKEHGLVIPCLFVASELLLLSDGSLLQRARRLWPGYLLLLLVGLLLLVARLSVLGSLTGSFTAEALAGSNVIGRALTMLQVVPQWFRLLSWPAHLRADYSPGEFTAATGFGYAQLFGVVLLVEAGVIAWAARRAAPVVSFGLAWCAIALFPVSNVFVPTGILMAERTLFLPSIGFVLAFGGGMDWMLRRAPGIAATHRRLLTRACASVLLLGVARSATRETVWRNDAQLWYATVHDAPKSWRAQHAYGDMLYRLGFPSEGRAAYERAIQWTPEPWRLRTDLARHLRELGHDSAAVIELRRSLALRANQDEAPIELVAALIGAGMYGDARHVSDSLITSGRVSHVLSSLVQVTERAIVTHAPAGSIRLRIVVHDSSTAESN
jgi:hypothetical protein